MKNCEKCGEDCNFLKWKKDKDKESKESKKDSLSSGFDFKQPEGIDVSKNTFDIDIGLNKKDETKEDKKEKKEEKSLFDLGLKLPNFMKKKDE